MKLKNIQDTKGIVSIEAMIAVPVIIIVFTLFFAYMSYCNTVIKIKNEMYNKAYELIISNYSFKLDVPREIKLFSRDELDKINIEYMYCSYENIGSNISIVINCLYDSNIIRKNLYFSYKLKKWLGDSYSESENIWQLSNYKRGYEVEKTFGANLPKFYPTIDRFDKNTGTCVLITSCDTTLKGYKTYEGLFKRINNEVEKMIEFDGYTYEEIRISKNDIDNRKIIVVIPKNPLNKIQLKVFDEIENICGLNDIVFELKRYQFKNDISE